MEEGLAFGQLDNLSNVHHRDPVANVLHHA